MRTFLTHFLSLTVLALPSCRCSPPTPVPITMRVVNGPRSPIYVEARTLGLSVRREVGGQLFAFDDQACPCDTCALFCDPTCTCPKVGVPSVRRIMPAEAVERAWDGVVRVSGVSGCQGGGCLDLENAPVNEPFSLQLCFSNQLPSGMEFDDAGVGEGPLPAVSLTCVDKTFQLQDGVVEVGPERGSACTTSADCKGEDELCFDGACTAGCPANDSPQAGVQITVGSQGFFTTAPRGQGTQRSGSGTITSAQFSGTGLEVYLSRPGLPGEVLRGTLTLTLPPQVGPSLPVNTPVSVTVVESPGTTPSRAVVIRDLTRDTVVFAADMGWQPGLLTAAELAPLTTASDTVPVGCALTDCGRLLFFERSFSAGASRVSLAPGRRGTLTSPQGTFTVINVSNGAFARTRCATAELRPWVLWREG